MVKLQLRLDQAQTNLIITALTYTGVGHHGTLDGLAYDALASWLRWRRDKLWGPPAGAAEQMTTSEALDRLHPIMSDRHTYPPTYPQAVDSQGKGMAKSKRT